MATNSITDLFRHNNKALLDANRGRGFKDAVVMVSSLKPQSKASVASASETTDEYLGESIKYKNHFVPRVEYDKIWNFAHFGSGKKYYEDAINRIYLTYPYDGSAKEKLEWRNNSKDFDQYIFDYEYPKTTGYVSFGQQWGTIVEHKDVFSDTGYIETIYLSSAPQYITVKGGPNAGIDSDRTKANIYETSSMRSTNLALDGNKGNTIEFWLRKDGEVNHSASISASQAIFDIWNGKALGSEEYGRFLLEACEGRNNSSSYPGRKFALTYASGASGFNRLGICASSSFPVSEYNWNHYAVTCKNSGSVVQYKLYVNGDIVESGSSGTIIGEVTGAYKMNIGAYLTALDTNGAFVSNGYGSGLYSYDELRFWKRFRTSKQIAQHWYTTVDGGTNTDNAASGLGVYYKFNEGIVNSSSWIASPDQTIVDYSGRISNGVYVNYASGSRNTGSAMTQYGIAPAEFEEPILYSYHQQVSDYYTEKLASGSAYDDTNNASMHKQMPLWILDEDAASDGHMESLIQIMASFFDVLFLYIRELSKIRNIQYPGQKEKALVFANKLLKSAGFEAPDIFANAEVLEELLSKSDERNFEQKLYTIKNEIYQKIYNNLAYLYKSKGTEKSIRNLVRCFGIDEELVDVNYYVDNMTYTLNQGYRSAAVKKKYVDFNHSDRAAGSVYQFTASNSDTTEKSFITASNADYAGGLTMEASVILPKKFDKNSTLYFDAAFLTSSVFGYHFAGPEQGETTFFENDFDCHVLAIRPYFDSSDVKFAISSSTGLYAETPVYKEEYDESRWHLAARLKNINSESVNRAASSANGSYLWELYGVKPSLDIIQKEFVLTASVTNALGKAMMTGSKRFYVGACHRNFTGSAAINYSDVKISNFAVWLNALADEELKAHAKDVESYGCLHPLRNAYGNQTTQNGMHTPGIESLALYWTFDNVLSASGGTGGLTSDAKFYVYDISSGSANRASGIRNGAIAPLVGYRYPGRGDFFLENDTNVTNVEYIYSARKPNPESLSETDTVNIYGDYEDEKYTKDQRPFKMFIGIEKSYSRAISKEMLNMFASIVDFNNLIGDPVNRYRQGYKSLEKLRQLFFERVGNTPDIEKYLEFYKWIDSSMLRMIQQLLPASANASDNLGTMIESHVLERNKYWNKYPTLEMKQKDPTGIIKEYELSGTVCITASATISGQIPRLYNGRLVGEVMLEDDKFWVRERRPDAAEKTIEDGRFLANTKKVQGNFYRNYEVVNVASGRRNKNSYLAQMNGEGLSGNSEIKFQGVDLNFALPERTSNESIIACKFAAPGGKENSSRGYLDRASEELSVYNAMPWRNIDVRNSFNATSSVHTDLTGTVGFEAQNKEKINRNAYVHPVSSSTAVVALGALSAKKYYDNAFIQHQMPQSDYQYLWISASSDKCALERSGSGYFHKDEFANIAISSSFVAYSKQYANLLSASNITNYNYGIEMSSWKQTRTAEHSASVYRRKNNFIGHQENSITTATPDYREPVVQYNQPIDMRLIIAGKESVYMRFSYDNMRKYFSSVALNNRLGLAKEEGSLFGDKIVATVLDGPEKYKLVALRKTSCLYPKTTLVTLSGSRERADYDEEAGKAG